MPKRSLNITWCTTQRISLIEWRLGRAPSRTSSIFSMWSSTNRGQRTLARTRWRSWRLTTNLSGCSKETRARTWSTPSSSTPSASSSSTSSSPRLKSCFCKQWRSRRKRRWTQRARTPSQGSSSHSLTFITRKENSRSPRKATSRQGISL